MSIVQDLIADLREKRLWPLAVILVIALVAVPVLLSSNGNSGTPVAQLPPVSPGGTVPSLPAVSVTPTPSDARLTGRERNPFAQQAGKATSPGKGSGSSTTSTNGNAPPVASNPSKGTSSSSSSSSSSSGSTGSPASGSVTVPASTPAPTTPAKPAPTVASLTDKQAYDVAISLTNTSGGAYTVDPVERLSPIPSGSLPLLIELGVLQGGHRVLFAVQPGTVVTGPGRCTPGPIDCEVFSLAPNQIEGVATQQSDGSVSGALMAVTAIKADNFSSAAAADRARQDESATGRRLLNASQQKALSLFPFRPGLGALVDLSNVTVGGN